jgi:hypothetical protein
MTENSNPEKSPGDLERRHDKLREWLIDALAMAVGALAVFHYKPEGMVATIIVFVGAYTITSVLQGLNWILLAAICEILLAGLGVPIHLGTLAMAPASFTGLVFTCLLPGIAQAYWMWALWPATGTLVHPLTLMCAAWLALLGIRIFAKTVFVNGRAPQSN